MTEADCTWRGVDIAGMRRKARREEVAGLPPCPFQLPGDSRYPEKEGQAGSGNPMTLPTDPSCLGTVVQGLRTGDYTLWGMNIC